MSSTIRPISKHPETGLLYAVEGAEATIVGCALPHQSRVEIPPVIEDKGKTYRVSSVGESAFAYMSGLQAVVLPETLTRIGHGAFEASGLTEVRLHPALEALAPYAFFGCPHLRRVELPLNARFPLEEQAFGGCGELKREQVVNLDVYRPEDLRRAGLPEAVAAASPTYVVLPGGLAGDQERPLSAQLLASGLKHEEQGNHVEAAVAYVRAHHLRAALGSIADGDAQVAALKDIAEAEYRLALLLKFGLAPIRNPDGSDRPQPHALLTQIVETSGLPDAAYHLGDMYAGGYDLPRNPKEALRLLRLAAGQGHERACLDLGYAYLYGTLDAASASTARHFFARCAEMAGPYEDVAWQELARLPL